MEEEEEEEATARHGRVDHNKDDNDVGASKQQTMWILKHVGGGGAGAAGWG